MIASRRQILAGRESGDIVIEPFTPSLVQTGSVDVRLGRNVWRRTLNPTRCIFPSYQESGCDWRLSILDADSMLILRPGERVLAHTVEFIGSRQGWVPQMAAKSTTARWGLTVCACAGWGDVGFFSRWAMEIKNLDEDVVVIPVGAVIAQIVFHEIAPDDETYATSGGRYQTSNDIDVIMRDWTPEMLLPKPMQVMQ